MAFLFSYRKPNVTCPLSHHFFSLLHVSTRLRNLYIGYIERCFECQQIYSYICKLSQTSSKLSSEQSIDVHVHFIYKVYRSTMYLKLSLLKSLHFVGVIHSYRSILSLWPPCNILIIMSDTFMHHSSMSSKNFHFYFISYDCSKIN